MKLYFKEEKKAQNLGSRYYEVTLSMLINASSEEEAQQNFADILCDASSNIEKTLEEGYGKSLATSNIAFTVKPGKYTQ